MVDQGRITKRQTANPIVSAISYCRSGRARFLTELKEFIRFASVSAQPDRAEDIWRCAQWLAKHLRRIGLESVKVIPTQGHPVVYAEWLYAPQRPTVLIYGHYDVQPPRSA